MPVGDVPPVDDLGGDDDTAGPEPVDLIAGDADGDDRPRRFRHRHPYAFGFVLICLGAFTVGNGYAVLDVAGTALGYAGLLWWFRDLPVLRRLVALLDRVHRPARLPRRRAPGGSALRRDRAVKESTNVYAPLGSPRLGDRSRPLLATRPGSDLNE